MTQGPSLTTLSMLGRAFQKGQKGKLGPDGKPWRSRFAPRTDRPENRPDMRPFIIQILSTHKKCPKRGMKRIQAVVKLLGITKTVHMDVPQDFTI